MLYTSKNQRGEFDLLIIPLVVSIILVLGLAGFSAWSFINYQDQKNNVDAKIEEAVAVANEALTQEKEAEFLEREKEPNRSFTSNGSLGNINFNYPKTWSAYKFKESGATPLDLVYHPKLIPEENTLYALRVEVNNKSYPSVIKTYDNDLEKGVVVSEPIVISEQQGIKLSGEIDKGVTGLMVILPLRDKTIQIWTETEQYFGDFNTTVIPSLTYTP